MRTIKLAVIYLLPVTLCLALSLVLWANTASEEKGFSFRWTFGALVGPEHDRKLTAITGDTELKTGDQLKFCLELKKICYVYLIYHSGQNEVDLLFPSNPEQFTTDYKVSSKYCIPQGDTWFELDEKAGRETFYLLASTTRLNELEALFPKETADHVSNQQERSKQILAKIRTLKKQHRKLIARAERPVPIGGSLRGMNKNNVPLDNEAIAMEVSVSTFYSRTFTIEHQ